MSAYIFDSETTGIKEPQIIEAAWLRIDSPTMLHARDEWCSRYKPGKPIDFGALATHHILEEDLVECPPYTDFRLPEDIEYLIGHNIDFDWAVIGTPQVKRICTLALCRQLWPEVDSHSQGAMLYYLLGRCARPLLRNAHSALQDVHNCKLILGHIMSVLSDLTTWEDLWLASEKARIPTVMPFGKHKGMAIGDIPPDYKSWLLKQTDIDPYLITALRGEKAA